jgi:AraC-like DNA-binding protein
MTSIEPAVKVAIPDDHQNVSPRQFNRVFRAETGHSPAKVIEKLRLENAKFLLEQGRLSVEAVAKEAGFGDRERMRRAFLRVFEQPPQAVRKSAGPPDSMVVLVVILHFQIANGFLLKAATSSAPEASQASARRDGSTTLPLIE